MTIDEVYKKFIYSKHLAGLSEKSIYDYEIFIGMFIQYVGNGKEVHSLSVDIVNDYIAYQVSRNLSRASLATYVRNLKIFLQWLENIYHVSLSASDIVVPKTPKTTPRIYSDKDIGLIFSSIEAESDWLTFRNCAMVALMLDSGLRQSEVCYLRKIDVDFNSNILRVHGKGNKERLVPLGAFSKQYIQKYLQICPYASTQLFIGRRGGAVTPDSLKHLIGKIGKKLPFEFSCHKLRHNFATNYCLDQFQLYGRIDIYSLMAIMGHENVKTTERYLHFAMQILESRQHISHLDRIMTLSG